MTSFERNRRVVLSGEGARARSIDEVTFERTDAGTRITYFADLRLKGIYGVAEPFVAGTLNRMGDDALAGLKSVLDRPA